MNALAARIASVGHLWRGEALQPHGHTAQVPPVLYAVGGGERDGDGEGFRGPIDRTGGDPCRTVCGGNLRLKRACSA